MRVLRIVVILFHSDFVILRDGEDIVGLVFIYLRVKDSAIFRIEPVDEVQVILERMLILPVL